MKTINPFEIKPEKINASFRDWKIVPKGIR